MIVLDTNVVSEPMRRAGHPAVQAWLDRQVAATLYLTTINLSELLLGVENLPKGRRKKELGDTLATFMKHLFASRILAFDELAAAEYARLVARAGKGGLAIPVADGQIAAIASIHGFAVATRDVAPFVAAGVPVVNPWEDSKG